jgi:hypothetical protein
VEAFVDGQHARAVLNQLRGTEADMRAAGCDEAASPNPRCPALQYRAAILRRFLAAHQPAAGSADDGESTAHATTFDSGEDACSRFDAQGENAYDGRWGGSYRTLCVRRCDGYFFPVSWETTAAYFKRDEAACRSKYPPGDADLYVQPSPRANNENALVSLTGEAYSSQPFAFSFRHNFDRTCASLLLGASLARNGVSPFVRGTRGAEALPSARVEPTALAQMPASDRHVRMVGSDYSYALPETADALPETAAPFSP